MGDLENVGKVSVVVGSAAVSVVGMTGAAVSAAGIIAATGGAAAVVLVGFGMYKWLSGSSASDASSAEAKVK